MPGKNIKRIKQEESRTEKQTGTETVLKSLISRGFRIAHYNPPEKVLLPEHKDTDKYYSLLKKYSFRLFLRDVIIKRHRFRKSDLTRYCNSHTAENYINFLLRTNLIENITKKSYKLVDERIDSFGDTLEWFISEILRREFLIPSLRSVKFQGLEHGGDYDIIAKLEENICFMEIKSSPPKHIHQESVKEFFYRLEDLNPEMAIFFTDTHLRLMDKINKMFRIELKERGIKTKITGKENTIFDINKKLFILRSKPDIAGNLRVAIRDFYKHKNNFW